MKDSQSKQFLEELVKIHAIKASTIRKPNFQGKQTNVIYELLQNADEAHATSATIELYSDKLIFKHNGNRHFTISNPSTEEEDSKSGKLGDINAITSNTDLSQKKMKIGKIGVGFISVFQYTITPMIYDIDFCFQINQYIIPGLINDDYSGRKQDETIFIFPFNNPEKSAKDCYTDISEKLNNFTYPTLFLQTLTQVTYLIPDKKIEIKFDKKIETTQNFNEITVESIILTKQDEKTPVWLFSRQIDSKYTISVCFFVNENGFLIPKEGEVNCFLPIKEKSHLNFTINAPFLLESNCETIDENNEHNRKMLIELSNLSAKSILLFKEIGREKNVRLIDDTILEIIPTSSSFYSSAKTVSRTNFYNAIQKVFQTEEIIPTVDGYVSKENAYFSCNQNLINLFSHEQFVQLVKNENAKLVFPSISKDEKKSGSYSSFISTIVMANVNESTLFNQTSPSLSSGYTLNFSSGFGTSSSTSWLSSPSSTSRPWNSVSSSNPWSNSLNMNPFNTNANSSCSSSLSTSTKTIAFKGIESDFIEKQSFEWLHQFYHWICQNNDRIKRAKFAPIFINSKGKAMSAYNKSSNSLQLFFPNDSSNETINPELIKNRETLIFAKKMGLTVPNQQKEIITSIIPKYEKEGYIDTFQDFKKIFNFYKFCSYEGESKFLASIRNVKFIMYFTRESSKVDRDEASNLYFPSKYLFEYFEHLPQKKFIAIDQYKELVEKTDEPFLFEFFEKMGVSKNVKIIKFEINNNIVQKYNLPHHYYTRYILYYEYRIEEFDYIWGIIQKDPKKAIVLWNVLLNLAKSSDMKDLSFGTCSYFYYCNHDVSFNSVFRRILVGEKWLLTNKNELVAPSEIFLKELPQQFHIDDEVLPLCKFLSVKTRDVALLTQENVDDLDFVRRLINAGMLQKVKKELEQKEAEMKQTKK